MTQPAALPRNHILVGDVRKRLSELPDASVHCIITSPPYFGLRDYGHRDQIGAERDVNAWAQSPFSKPSFEQVVRVIATV